jgi:peptide/nickel transport system permease protein
MVADGRIAIEVAWWASLFAGLAIIVVVLCLTLFGDRLRDRLDPKLRGI